ncbi:MAG: DNA primase [Clostridiales bacterium]|nr:DNA primase [Clostridiales bacterium]
MRISQDFIDEIKFRNRIEDVVSSYVTLKHAGSNLTGLCPFHSEKTPSFFVSSARSTFHCFGCGAGGDVITFVMQAENLDYLSALEVLARRVGMEMPRDDEKNSDFLRRDRIFAMNREAARFFNASLSSPDAEAARAYLVKRGLSSAAVKHFGLGYSPNSFDALKNHLSSLGYKEDELATAFLCGKSAKTGRFFDYFRGRLMFPIIDNFGNVIAFGGRATDDSTPKYLNTSDTPAFKKSRNLFALNFARNSDYDYMILCEGYMDVIAMHMAGFNNAVATLGTALTSEQARILAKYTKKIVLSYDSDEAGINATKRALPILAEVGLDVNVLQVKDAKDPDEFIKKFGADKFRVLVEGSKSKLEFLCDSVLRKYNIVVPEEKIKASAELCEAASAVFSNVEREIYIDRISERLGIDKNSFKADVERRRRTEKKKEETAKSQKIIADSLGYGDTVNRERAANIKAAKAEEAIIGMMLVFPEFSQMIRAKKIELCAEDFITEFNRRVFEAIINSDGKTDLGMLAQDFSVSEIARMESMMEKRAELSDNSEKVLKENITALKAEAKTSDDAISATLELLKKKK